MEIFKIKKDKELLKANKRLRLNRLYLIQPKIPGLSHRPFMNPQESILVSKKTLIFKNITNIFDF